MRGCVIAGVWGAGKTAIYRRVLSAIVSLGCDHLLALPQAASITTHTYRPGSPSEHAEALLSWLRTLSGYLDDVDTRFRASSLPRHRFAPCWTPTLLGEGLGFDVPVYELPVRRAALMAREEELARLGIDLVMLHVPRQAILQQCVVATRHHRGPRWARYLTRFGADDAAIASCIAERQDELLHWARTSPMPTHLISTGGGRWDDYAAQVTRVIIGSGRASLLRSPPSRPSGGAARDSQPPSSPRPPAPRTRSR